MSPRLLYAGSLRPGGNGLDRVALFEAAGFEVVQANRYRYMMMGTRLGRSLAARFNFGPSVRRFNRLLTDIAAEDRFDIVFVDKGVWIWPQTLKRLKRAAQLLVHYTPDAQFREYRSRHFYRGLPDYDLAVTTKPFEVDAYRTTGAQELMLILQGYGTRIVPVSPEDIPEPLRSDICFIGHCQPAYALVLEQLAARVPLAIWGPGWTEFAQKNHWAQNVVRGEGLYGPDYTRALSGAKIAIGLLSKRIPETTTTRSFEIPAAGTMLLAERTDEHLSLFEEGREAEFFGSVNELCDKASHYLDHPDQRAVMATAGRARCLSSGYSIENQFNNVIEWIAARLEAGAARKKGDRNAQNNLEARTPDLHVGPG